MELNGWASPQMLRRYGASARSARARRIYDRIMTDLKPPPHRRTGRPGLLTQTTQATRSPRPAPAPASPKGGHPGRSRDAPASANGPEATGQQAAPQQPRDQPGAAAQLARLLPAASHASRVANLHGKPEPEIPERPAA
jgi:hypothetical protein